jgi:hypothetical protein
LPLAEGTTVRRLALFHDIAILLTWFITVHCSTKSAAATTNGSVLIILFRLRFKKNNFQLKWALQTEQLR